MEWGKLLDFFFNLFLSSAARFCFCTFFFTRYGATRAYGVTQFLSYSCDLFWQDVFFKRLLCFHYMVFFLSTDCIFSSDSLRAWHNTFRAIRAQRMGFFLVRSIGDWLGLWYR